MPNAKNEFALRQKIRAVIRAPESECIDSLLALGQMPQSLRSNITKRAVRLVKDIRTSGNNSLMELFLEEYGLSTDEGVALMCLAEALLRVPDTETIDALIEDKIAPSKWGQHLGQSSSSLVNASTWALMITGSVLNDDTPQGIARILRSAIKRLGEPVIRTAVSRAMRELGAQFVLGRDIEEAMSNAATLEQDGYTYSYDMLGEAAMTEADAKRFHLAYSRAITALAPACTSDDIRKNPGISVKLSALFSRYEQAQRKRAMDILVPRTRSLALLAKSVGIGFNIDAEEADRLDLSLDIIDAVLSDPSLEDWDGFGVVVQAYGKRAPFVLDWLYALAERLDRKIMVRLVKGAYWDSEIKKAQVQGLDGFPVFTNKAATDVSYITCAQKLLDMRDRIYPQFATHNARTVAAVLEMANGATDYEFQRLHGMGEALHEIVHKSEKTKCRIYAPVGPHKDLLAYLVRRLLENGANSSFVNQIVDETVPPEIVAADPITKVLALPKPAENPATKMPKDLFAPRQNSRGFDLTDPVVLERIHNERDAYKNTCWKVAPLLVAKPREGANYQSQNPADASDTVAKIQKASLQDVKTALQNAASWDASPTQRAKVLNRAADLYEENYAQIFALLAREAGKTLLDCDAELREAVDFLRYYAASTKAEKPQPRGIFTCISPWNFPVAIFSGQIAAALGAGNGVLAKPAEQSPALAWFCTGLMHEAGVPKSALQLLIGDGEDIGAALCKTPQINGVCFTGGTDTAQIINKTMAKHAPVDASLIAETGGLNAMIVDSTALPEQAVRDILASGFQSAGQRCSALRCLYLQDDVADDILKMLYGAMDELVLGNPWDITTDIGPVIDTTAQREISDHIKTARKDGRLLKELPIPRGGLFISPSVIELSSINDLEKEIFGPVIHVIRYAAQDIDKVIAQINATGYGLTFGLHTRIDDRVQHIVDAVHAGNIYVNRNQIGAIVGSQPFGGHGLSGTGPKAGGPLYLNAFSKNVIASVPKTAELVLPGPTGESNHLTFMPRGRILCLGNDLEKQADLVTAAGCEPVFDTSSDDPTIDAIIYWGDDSQARELRLSLASRTGPIIPLILDKDPSIALTLERHLCIDTTAAGGNAALLGENTGA